MLANRPTVIYGKVLKPGIPLGNGKIVSVPKIQTLDHPCWEQVPLEATSGFAQLNISSVWQCDCGKQWIKQSNRTYLNNINSEVFMSGKCGAWSIADERRS